MRSSRSRSRCRSTDPRYYLGQCGATEAEQNFLVRGGGSYSGWHGERVELNAMTSDRLIEFLEAKLDEEGVKKVVPDLDTLRHAYGRASFRRQLLAQAEALAEASTEIDIPDDLEARVRDYLDENDDESWDEAVAAIEDQEEEAE